MSFSTVQSVGFRAAADSAHRATHCVPTSLRALPRLTRTALILGPNSSGKSNLLAALGVMRDLVLHSTSLTQTRFMKHYRPFANRPTDDPTTLLIELLLDGIRYRYGFSYNSEHIVSESLHVYKNNRAQRWFERSLDGGPEYAWQPFSPHFQGPREMWRKATRPQALFLSAAVQLNSAQLSPITYWFRHQLDIVMSSTTPDLSQFATRVNEDNFKSKVLDILRSVDLPVADLRVKDAGEASAAARGIPPAGDSMADAVSLELLYTRVGRPPVWLDIKQDSSGARGLLSVLTPLIDGIEQDRFIAFDEFDTHLHPLIARYLLRLINDPAATHRRVQVLLISHTTALLDLEILRRDELWLMNVDLRYGSQLTSFTNHRARKHELIAKAYLRGDYGAVPRIDGDRLGDVSSP